MKSTFLIFVLLFLGISPHIFGQTSQGVILYEMRMDMHRTLPANRADLRNMIPQFRTDTFQLIFSPTASIYKPQEVTPAQSAAGGGGGMRMMRMPRTETFIDKVTRQRRVFLEFLGRNILIDDTLQIDAWRIGNETMVIAGHVCLMAWQKDTVNNVEITAWFAPKLPPFQGPDRFGTLPGTVLAVDINNGERVWVARRIDLREVKPEEILKPTRGDVMTRKEFNQFIEAQRQRMNQNAPGSGAMLRVF
ncbi:MAG TPA: GLPGLI family protein [Bacteroidales bacterium]|nr:GLPGLI family protein [Bacteroidales bacterium]